MPNGSTIYAYSAESPERQRGPNLSGVWADELAAWRFGSQTWEETLLPAVRINNPRIVVTTTPKATTPLLRELLGRDDLREQPHIRFPPTGEIPHNQAKYTISRKQRQRLTPPHNR